MRSINGLQVHKHKRVFVLPQMLQFQEQARFSGLARSEHCSDTTDMGQPVLYPPEFGRSPHEQRAFRRQWTMSLKHRTHVLAWLSRLSIWKSMSSLSRTIRGN